MSTPLQPWQQRVIDERKELDQKRAALDAFVLSPAFEALAIPDRLLMRYQQHHMAQYSGVLGQRIARFELKNAAGEQA